MKSDKRHIEQLLRRFLNGESTIAEEETLSRYFASHEVDSEWIPFKQMFAYFDDAMSEKPVVKTKRQPLWLHPWIRRVAAAATVALAIGVVWNILAPSQGNVATLPMIDESQSVAESTIEKTSPYLVPDLATAAIQKKQISASTRSACAATFTDNDDIDIKQVLDSRLISDISVEDAINTHNEELLAARQALENEMAEYNIDDIPGAQTVAVP